MRLATEAERAIYGAAYAQRLSEERSAPNAHANAIAGAKTPKEVEERSAEFETFCADAAIDFAEWAVWVHRRARKSR